MPNAANYLSACYPSVPMGQDSVSKYQKAMYERMKRRKEAANLYSVK